jgi:hypothetical protein
MSDDDFDAGAEHPMVGDGAFHSLHIPAAPPVLHPPAPAPPPIAGAAPPKLGAAPPGAPPGVGGARPRVYSQWLLPDHFLSKLTIGAGILLGARQIKMEYDERKRPSQFARYHKNPDYDYRIPGSKKWIKETPTPPPVAGNESQTSKTPKSISTPAPGPMPVPYDNLDYEGDDYVEEVAPPPMNHYVRPSYPPPDDKNETLIRTPPPNPTPAPVKNGIAQQVLKKYSNETKLG